MQIEIVHQMMEAFCGPTREEITDDDGNSRWNAQSPGVIWEYGSINRPQFDLISGYFLDQLTDPGRK